MKKGFTLAEVLITLVVVGVVSVLTLPALINKIQDSQFDAGRQKALASIGQAGRILVIQGILNEAGNEKEFVENYLSKQLKIAKFCESNAKECGFADKIKTFSGNEITMPKKYSDLGVPSSVTQTYRLRNRNIYSFLMNNGYSVSLAYNPQCVQDDLKSSHGYLASVKNIYDLVCINAIYDMNGNRGPNQVGKDIGFISFFYPNEMTTVVAPKLAKTQTSAKWADASKTCEKGYHVPGPLEIGSAVYNIKLTNVSGAYWTNVGNFNDNRVGLSVDTGIIGRRLLLWKNQSQPVRCVE